jgi:hypothetical protein
MLTLAKALQLGLSSAIISVPLSGSKEKIKFDGSPGWLTIGQKSDVWLDFAAYHIFYD